MCAATLTSEPFSSRRATDTMKRAPGTCWPLVSLTCTGQLADVRTGRPRRSLVASGAYVTRLT
jgi:hypothetical protein